MLFDRLEADGETQEDQDRPVRHLRRGARKPPRQARHRGQDTGAPRPEEAAGHLRRSPAPAHQPADGTHPYIVQPGRHRHGPAQLQQPQPAEHPHPRRGRQGNPQGLHPRRRLRILLAPTTRRLSCASWPTSAKTPT